MYCDKRLSELSRIASLFTFKRLLLNKKGGDSFLTSDLYASSQLVDKENSAWYDYLEFKINNFLLIRGEN